MIESIKISTIDGNTYRFKYKDILHYDFEYKADILRIDFKDCSFIEFTRSNIVFVEVDMKQEKQKSCVNCKWCIADTKECPNECQTCKNHSNWKQIEELYKMPQEGADE